MQQANCSGKLELMYPEPTSADRAAGRLSPAERRAVAICVGCPVQAECLAAALSQPEEFGVWGGLTEYERARTPVRPQDGSTGLRTAVTALLEWGEDRAEREGLIARRRIPA